MTIGIYMITNKKYIGQSVYLFKNNSLLFINNNNETKNCMCLFN